VLEEKFDVRVKLVQLGPNGGVAVVRGEAGEDGVQAFDGKKDLQPCDRATV